MPVAWNHRDPNSRPQAVGDPGFFPPELHSRSRPTRAIDPGKLVRPTPIDPDTFIRTDQLAADSRALAEALPPDVDLVVAIPRSGLIPGAIIAAHLHIPLHVIDGQAVHTVGRGFRLDSSRETPRRIALIDDTAAIGREMARRGPIVAAAFPGSAITRAVVYSTPEALGAVDLAAGTIQGPHYLEWNWINAGHGIGCVYDFDGILCHDCRPEDDDDGPRYREFLANVRPLYLPRRRPIHTIATARHEKYRAETLDWMDRHGVSVQHLVMRDWDYDPGGSFAEQVGRWKAEHYIRSGQPLMAESCPEQARIIADASGKPVICPAAGRVVRPTAPPQVTPPGGPGTELHRLIDRVGSLAGMLARVVGPIAPAIAKAITLPAPEGCGCQSYAAWMDRHGPQGCRQRLDAITDHLIAQGERQGLTVPRWAARAAVRHSIRRAEQ